ncbi:PKS-NRPS hybrid synthetase CHGG_01239-like [Olea europaea var. sylvestris]|uniref:PKS-NRPS hybrid synthetase CHGG_01239-like n=1 Tax=Olea europaea var. sylvestris TaxID=158386 RepID=UPI000C1D8161|nr:PKS-NRPS hybrid synthetase CHGG_01239-like [Olea europaea var. sylvestris]
MLTVVCVDDNCKWMLRASTVKQSAIFMISKFVAVHTYSLDFHRNAHRHATSAVIAEHILGKLDTPYRSYPPTHIARDMEREFGVKISYSKARRGKLRALNMLHGTPRDSFQKLSSYCHVVGESNPGTFTHIEVDFCNRFCYFFVAFGASICGYMQYLRPIICVDGSHLKGPYKGTLLVATAQDGNKQIYPLAWGIVDAETNKSWKWFLSNLKDLIGDSEELVFVSDRKKSIQKAISQLFPSSRHGCCIWHMEKNLIQRYNKASLLFLFKRAATTFRVEDFERLMGQIRRVNKRAHGYLERAGYSFWSRALFIGHRYNIMTNNNAESLNSMLREARSLPITCLVEHIRSTFRSDFTNVEQMRKNAVPY